MPTRILWAGGVLVGLAVFAALFIRCCCITEVESYEVGYRYDLRTGHTAVVPRTGYIWHAPIVVEVRKVDLRPMQVCINTNSRVLNCKLVQFQVEGLDLFLAWHGRDDYDSGKLNPILMSYAYEGSGRTYPFLRVLRELKSEEKP